VCGVGGVLLGSDLGVLNSLTPPYIYIFTIFQSDRNGH
jgi:hypothetical protein